MKRALLLFLFFLAAAGPARAEVAQVNQFSGLNTDDSPLDLQGGQTPDSQNVLTDDGPGVKGRQGFVAYSTEPSAGLWEFPVSDGTRYLITRSGSRLKATTTSGAGVFTVLISTVPTDRVVAAAPLGDRFYFADTLNGLKYWNGTSVTVASAALTVDKLVSFKGRLAAAGKSAAGRTLYLSKYLDGTSWTAPVNPSDDDAAQIVVAGALDENIQALYATFQDKLMWFKSNSFGAIYGSRRSNFIQRTFSDRVGVSSPETIQDCDGRLRWLGANRQVWEFDGSAFGKISEDVDTLFAQVTQGDSAARSLTQTSESDFEAGSQSPSGIFDTTTTPGSLTPRTTTFADTLAADFALGTDSPSGYTAGAANTLQLATATAVADFTDTAQADFQAGTLTSLDATTIPGTLLLPSTTVQVNTFTGASGTALLGGASFGAFSGFVAVDSQVVSGVQLYVKRIGNPGTMSFQIRGVDGSGNVSAAGYLGSVSVNANTFSTSFSYVSISFASSPVALSKNATYYVGFLRPTGGSGNVLEWGGCDTLEACGTRPGKFCTDASFDGTGASCVPATKYGQYKVDAFQFPASGNIVSRTYDVGNSTATWLYNFGTFTANASLAGGAIAYQTQTSADGSNWNSLATATSGSLVPSPIGRYVRYKATFTPSTTASPQLNDVTIGFSAQIRPSAIYTSRTFDTGMTSPYWGLFTRDTTTAGPTTGATFYTQTSNDGASWDARVAQTNGVQIASARKRYLRYQVDLAALNATSYVKVDDITLIGKSTGIFTTASFNLGSLISAWGPFGWSSTDNGGGITVKIATSSDGISFTTFTAVSNGNTPTFSLAPFAKAQFTFDLDVATDAPTLNDATFAWVEGANVRAASMYYNQRYWLSVAIASTTNNRILLFDKKRQWQRYSGIAADAFVLFNSVMYFGSPAGIFQAESGYSDNGSAITAYYTTPTIAPAGFDVYSKFLDLYAITDNSDSTLSTSVYLEGDAATTYSLGSQVMNATSGTQNIKYPFPVSEIQQGRLINLKWQVPGTSFWRVLRGNLYFDRDAVPY